MALEGVGSGGGKRTTAATSGRRGSGGTFGTPTTGRSLGSSVAPRAAVSAPPAPAPSTGGGGWDGGGGSGGGGGGGSIAAPAPVVIPPMRDIDWFNQDSVYRGQSGRALTDLTSQLAQILADRDAGYRQLDTSRDDLSRGRDTDLRNLGNDFAGRGLLGSGLYAQDADEVAADYARQGSALDETANRLAQQYGQRSNMVDLSGLQSGNAPANLSSIYGLLGAMGVGAGNNYNQALGRARAESASRATQPLIQTTNW